MSTSPVLGSERDTVAPVAPPRGGFLSGLRGRIVSTLSSYRLRILAWFVLLLALGTAATVAVVGEVLLQGTDERIRQDLTQESAEFEQLAGGNDPATGEPFGDDVRRIFDVFLDRNVPARNEVILTFLDGEFYARSAPIPRYELGRDASFVEAVARAAQLPDATTGRIPSPVGEVDYLAVPVRVEGETRGVFTIAAFRDLERAEQDDILRAVATVGVVLLVIGTILAWRLADRVLAPVRRTAATARSISETDLSRRVAVNGRDEVAELAQTFNEMLDRVSAAFDAQRRFMDDAGHELRTPLTIVQGHLELLDEGTPEERERARELLLDELDRMARLVNDLVLLAAATRPDFVRRSEIDAAELAESVYEKARVLGERDWRLAVAGTGTLSADRQRLTQALLQLVDNAVRHTARGDVIEIGVDVDARSARIWVRDTGRGIPDGEQEAIFRRFYRASGDGRSSGAGLGLSIVQAIAEAHGGHASVDSRTGHGATFTLVITRTPRTATAVGAAR
jgi:signal transduction histidine kinase